MKTYLEIRSLVVSLEKSSKVQERRLVAERLQQKLALPEIRARIAHEAAAGNDIASRVKRRKALAELWRYIIKAAVISTQKMVASKTRLREVDIVMPFKLIRCCDMPYEAEDDVPGIRPYRPSLLSRSETKLVFNYCYDMLQDDTALELAEHLLLENLAYLCSRKEYVANMRAAKEMHAIVQEVEIRIMGEDPPPTNVLIAAGEVFEKLIDTACSLGIGLHILFSGCVKMVAEWCSRHSKLDKMPSEMKRIIRGLATLLRSDLHQAVAPLTRHGRRILSFARKAYLSDTSSDSRRALSEYIYSHLLVAQTAGELQGLLTGDLGDLGDASLTMKHVTSLLDMLLGDVFNIDLNLDELSDDHQFQLELVARFLSCAQRAYLEDASWTAMQNDSTNVISFIERVSSCSSTRNDVLTPKQLLDSPFWDIFHFVYPVLAAGMNESPVQPENDNSVIQEMRRSAASSIDVKSAVAVLRITTACAHHFPSGRCWTSSSQNWQTICAAYHANADVSDTVFLGFCSGDDLCLLVRILADLLEWSGSTTGNAALQSSTLRCTISLTRTMVVIAQFLDPHSVELNNLRMAWRRVWEIIVKPDLIYQSKTKNGKSDSVGRQVLILLREMVVHPCLDHNFGPSDTLLVRQSSYVFQHQNDLWNLPCYSQHFFESLECFLLVYSILARVGLSETGQDSIEFQFSQELTRKEKTRFNRRSRLLIYCLRAVEAGVSAPTSAAVAACLGALVHGNASFLSDIFRTCSLRDTLLPSYYNISTSNVFCLLWRETTFDPRMQHPMPNGGFSRRERDVLDTLLDRSECSPTFSDFVPRSDSSGLLGLVSAVLSELFLGSPNDSRAESYSDGDISDNLHQQFLLWQYLVTVMTCSGQVDHEEQQSISTSSTHLIRCFISGVPYLTSNVRSFWSAFANMNVIVRVLSIMASNYSIEWTSELLHEAVRLGELCNTFLESRTMPRLHVSRSSTVSSIDFFDEGLSEDEPELRVGTLPNNDSKRKRREFTPEVSAKKVALDCCPPSPNCTVIVAGVLLALDPNADAARKLTGIENIEAASSDDFDRLGTAIASNFLCMEESLLCWFAIRALGGGEANARNRQLSLIHRMLSAIRAASPPEDDFHLFGYDLLRKVIVARDDPDLMCSLDSEDSKCLIGLLVDVHSNSERKSLLARPTARTLQLQSATRAFNLAGEEFHEAFDKEFAVSLVLPSLFDISSQHRRVASQAVGCATRLLPEEKVTESIRKRLFMFEYANFQREHYREWYASKSVGGGNLDAFEKQVWEDSFLSIRDSSLRYWCAVASESTNDGVLKQFVFDLSLLAKSTPACEGLCLLSLDRMARQKGERKCEIFVDHTVAYLVEHWLEKELSLLDFPLLVTSPSLVRELLKRGYYSRVFLMNSGDTCSRNNIKAIREAAATEFISRFSHIIIPRVLSSFGRKCVKTGISIDLEQAFVTESYMKEICSVYSDNFDQGDVCKIIASNLPGIVAHVSWLASDNDENRSIALLVEQLVRSVLTDAVFLRRCEKHFESAQKLLLDIGLSASTNGEADNFFEAHKKLSTMVSAESHSASYVLLLYYSRYLMSLRVNCASPDVVWNPLNNAIKLGQVFVERGPGSVAYFKIAIQLLTSIVGDRTYQKVHTLCLRMLALLSEKLLVLTVNGESLVAGIFGDVLLVVFQALDESIISFTEQDALSSSRRQSTLIKSLGLVGGYNLNKQLRGDTWGWCESIASDISMASKRYPTPSCIAESCLSFVSDFMKKCAHSKGLESKLIGAYRASRISSVSKDSLKLQSFLDVRDQIEKVADSTNIDPVNGTEIDIATFIEDIIGSGKHSKRGKTSSSSFTAIDRKRITNKLVQLEKVLHDSRRSETSIQQVQAGHVQALGLLCSSAFPRDVRLAASRCFGELDISKIVWENEYANVRDCWLHSAVRENHLIRSLQARCIEALCYVLKSPNPFNSSIAAQTLTALLSTRVGTECRSFISAEVGSVIEIFYSQSKRRTNTVEGDLFLDEHEIALLRTKCGVDEDSDNGWCWTQHAWSARDWSSYEDWLCTIVPSVLLCLYYATGTSTDGDLDFFCLLKKITFLESSVAEAVFPLLIVDLLHNAIAGTTPSGDKRDDLIDSIGSCFETLLKQCEDCDRQERQYLDLILNTLEVLRQSTQSKFMLSRSPRKSQTTEAVSAKEKDQVSPQKAPGTTHNPCTRAIRWAGLRFGVIIHLDGFLVMRAFLKAGRVAAAIFYAELYADSRYGGSSYTKESINALLTNTITDHIGSGDISGFASQEYANRQEEDLALISRNFLNTLRECYAELEEVDNVNALTQFVADIDVRSPEKFLSMLREKDDVFACCNTSNEYQTTVGVADGLDHLGLDFALQHYISGATTNSSVLLSEIDSKKMKEKWFKCQLFRMCWADSAFQETASSVISQPRNDLRPGFFESMVNAMNAMYESDYDTCYEHSEEARWNLITRAFDVDVRSQSENILRAGSYLRSLNDLQRVVRSDEPESVRLPPALEGCGSFRSQRELPLYCRELILRHLKNRAENETKTKHVSFLLDQLWETSSISLKCGDLRMASGALSRIHSALNSEKENLASTDSLSPLSIRLRMEETILLEKSGNFTAAITSSQRTIERLTQQLESLSCVSRGLVSDMMLNCSKWMAKYKTDPVHHVLTQVLSPGKDIAVSVMNTNPQLESNIKRASECLLTMSSLGHALFESGLKRINSVEFQRSGNNLESRKKELDECKRLQKSHQSSKQGKEPSDLAIYEHNLTKEIRQMEAERSETFMALNAHLKIVLEATSSAFRIVGTHHNLGLSTFAYRLIGVWFSAIEEELYDDDVDKLIHEALERIPSFRFVPLANQLFAQLETSLGDGTHRERIHGLIIKLCLEHPYHCLVHLIAAFNGNNVGKGVDGRSAATYLKNTSERKVEAANFIIHTVKQKDPEFVSRLFENYRALSDAYIHLAMVDVKRAQKISFATISAKSGERLDSCLGRKGRTDYMPCILTKPPPIRPGRDYGEGREDPKHGERVLGFDSYFTTSASGVHVPKIVVCKGSKGNGYRQLVKGQDEIRQDAVMQQVFGLLNEFVAQKNQNSESSGKHALHQLITYNIVPLTPTSGVLEWVEDSAPFGDLIVDNKNGLHPRYFPDEWANKVCYGELQDAKRGKEQREVFDRICSHYSPSFRYFFLERFGHVPEKWYDAKMRYTRSVAVSSIVGHVLGIGDRHCSNILVHEKSGEVVQIDFGYVFEQGKLLAIPERVPFRLTRNVIDGFGVTGVEGLFTKMSESTMHLLKSNTNALLTILSAMASDPLYKWNLSPTKIRNRRVSMERKKRDDQDDNFDPKEKNKAAARAISKVHEKLQGYEDGTAGEQQSVEGQVQLLINSARDHGNLSSMYPGWQPWV